MLFKSFLIILFAIIMSTEACAFDYDSNHTPYTIQEGFCKNAFIENQTPDCKKYLLAPEDISQAIDNELECKWLGVLINERGEVDDQKGKAGWQFEFDQKCSSVDWERIQLLQKYWSRTDLSLEGKSEFLDSLIRLPEALFWGRK